MAPWEVLGAVYVGLEKAVGLVDWIKILESLWVEG
jgi:hypothetical protein